MVLKLLPIFEGLGFSFRKFFLRKKSRFQNIWSLENVLLRNIWFWKQMKKNGKKNYGCFHKSSKTIIIANMYIKANNLRLLSLWKHLLPFLAFSPHFYWLSCFLDFWGVISASYKNILFVWWNLARHDFPKLTSLKG